MSLLMAQDNVLLRKSRMLFVGVIIYDHPAFPWPSHEWLLLKISSILIISQAYSLSYNKVEIILSNIAILTIGIG